jgi:hypothetical protein
MAPLAITAPQPSSSSKRARRSDPSPTDVPDTAANGSSFTWGGDEEVFRLDDLENWDESMAEGISFSPLQTTQYKTICLLDVAHLDLAQSDVNTWSGHLSSSAAFGAGYVDPMDLTISRHILVHDDDEFELNQLLTRIFKGATIPRSKWGDSKRFPFTFWTRSAAKKGGTLLAGKELVHRALKNRSFVWTMPMHAAWPPPLFSSVEPGHNFLWSFRLNPKVGKDEDDILAPIIAALQRAHIGFLFRAVRIMFLNVPSPILIREQINKDGAGIPLTWYLRIVRRDGAPVPNDNDITEWLKSGSGGGIVAESVWRSNSCRFCWQNAVMSKGGKPHTTLQCLLLSTFNKVRKNTNLIPITISQEGVSASLKKNAVKAESVAKDVDKWQKEFRGMLSAFEKRLGTVEKKCGVKHKADEAESSTTPKKKKGRKESGTSTDSGAKAPKPRGVGSDIQQPPKKGKGKATRRPAVVDNRE